jgi:transglutaminase-like putative cysteine protease
MDRGSARSAFPFRTGEYPLMSPGLCPALLCFVLSADLRPAQMLEVKPAQRIEAEASFTYQFPELKAQEWVIFAAQAPLLPCQTRVSSSLLPEGKPLTELSGLHRPMLQALVNGNGGQRLEVRVKYLATLMSRRLVPLKADQKAPMVSPLTKEEQQATLDPSLHIDFRSAEFATWQKELRLSRAKDQDEVAFARHVFEVVRKRIAYKYEPDQDRHASKLCGCNTTDCGGMSILFTAVMRANQIPARCLVGRWAQSAKANDNLDGTAYYQWHVKAEFYAKGIGWVPVDTAGGVFGNDPGDFLVMHVDPDLRVDTKHFGEKPITWAQGAVFWVTGQGNLDKGSTQEDWKVRKLP